MDWIETFMRYTDGVNSAEIFRLWAGITAVGGSLDRRVWTSVGKGPIYPNLYTVLIGTPGTGKTQSIEPVKELWRQTKDLRIAPDNVTHAALIDSLNKNSRAFIDDRVPGGMLEIHSLLISADELGVLFSHHDLDFLSVLNKIYGSPPNYTEERRSMEGRNPDIANPQMTILAGTQPEFLSAILPEEAWGMGFCSRITMVYASEPPEFELFNENSFLPTSLQEELIGKLNEFAQMYGALQWSKPAKMELSLWYKHGMPPIPTHSKLEYYKARRLVHCVKLIIISAISAGNVQITADDVLRAKKWMLDAEEVMPDIFRAMMAKSDAEAIQELHMYVWKVWSVEPVNQRKPVREEEIYSYMQDKMPSEKIEKIITIAERAGLLKHTIGMGWTPKPIVELRK